ncbi:hypothetical protein EJD97_006010 [Solanum chilense]|uniref:Knottins-like domain-containing protein n=1 Tax=Solanum chilense TaxID=4083 RepID=A0A6N2AIR3_SOLCI|nr:hypothetical protein EJD97_006010 [Solanum chilense]
MTHFMSFFSTVLFLTIFVMTTEFGPMGIVEARICETPSQSYAGLCLSDLKCASACETEGFTGGNCHGFRRRCFCTKQCYLE